MQYVNRHLQSRVERSLDFSRVVVVHGPRQAGKTTLGRRIADGRGGSYAPLDDPAVLKAVKKDPYGFLTSYSPPLVVDEVQRGGDDLIRTVKLIVDRHPERKGRFLLSGSSSFLTVPTLSESLAGRAIIQHLWPLSEAEISGAPSTVVDGWFADPGYVPYSHHDDQYGRSNRRDHLVRACRGGFPDAPRDDPEDRADWFESYITTVIQRDIQEFADIRKADVLYSLMRWACAVSGSEVNVSSVAKKLLTRAETVRNYLEWLKMVFLVQEAPSWRRNLAGREVRRRKLYVTDTGIIAAQLQLTADQLMVPTATQTGPLLETFVFNEITRQASASSTRFKVYHYRDDQGREVDMIIEGPGGAIIAVEVKASSSPHPREVRHMEWLRDEIDAKDPDAFRAGILLHSGNQRIGLSDRIHLRPISDLWQHRAERIALT